MQSDEKKPRPSGLAKYLRYYHIGFQFFVGVLIFTLAGVWLDRKLGTEVLFTLLGLFLGFAGGLRALYIDLYGRKGVRRGGAGEGSEDGEERTGGKS